MLRVSEVIVCVYTFSNNTNKMINIYLRLKIRKENLLQNQRFRLVIRH